MDYRSDLNKRLFLVQIYKGARNFEFAFFVKILLLLKAFKKLNEYRDLTKPPQNKVHTL